MKTLSLPVVAVSLCAALLTVACDSSTGPAAPRIEGILDDRILGTQGVPFGFAISSQGEALVLQQGVATAGRFAVGDDTVAGFVPLRMNAIDVAFTASGAFAYVTIQDGFRVFEVDMASGTVVDSLTFGHAHHRILMHPDDESFWVASSSGTIWRVDRSTGAYLDSAALGAGELRGISRRRSDGSLAVSAGNTVQVLNGATLNPTRSVDLLSEVQDVVHSRDGTSLFVALEDANRILRLDAATLAVRDSITFGGDLFQPFALELSPDGRTLVASGPIWSRIAVIDAQAFAVTRIVPTGGTPRRIAFSPDGRRVFVANEAGWVDVIR